jgi:hypothetical protein
MEAVIHVDRAACLLVLMFYVCQTEGDLLILSQW